MRVVIDTNVFVSAVLGGALAEILDRWKAGHTAPRHRRHRSRISGSLARPKFALPVEVVDTIISYVFHNAEFAVPTESLVVVAADPKDDKFLEAAVAGDAELVVSGDRHLLALVKYRAVAIITAREFLDRLQSQASAA